MYRFTRIALAASISFFTFASFAATSNGNITPEERAKIESVVHDYLLKNPQILVESIQVLQKKQADQTQQIVKETQKVASSFAQALFHQAGDPVAGNANGTVTVVEFFDYQCPHCVEMSPTLDAIMKANPQVRVVYKEFPIRGTLSDFAARAALAANMQGKYAAFSHALLLSNKPITEALVLETAKNTGLDVDKLKTDMDSSAIKKQVEMITKLAQDLKLFGTPAIFVGKSSANGKEVIHYIPGQAEKTQLQGLIDQVK